MTTKNKVVKTLHNNTEDIRSYGVKKIGIFGSFVRAAQNNKGSSGY